MTPDRWTFLIGILFALALTATAIWSMRPWVEPAPEEPSWTGEYAVPTELERQTDGKWHIDPPISGVHQKYVVVSPAGVAVSVTLNEMRLEAATRGWGQKMATAASARKFAILAAERKLDHGDYRMNTFKGGGKGG